MLLFHCCHVFPLLFGQRLWEQMEAFAVHFVDRRVQILHVYLCINPPLEAQGLCGDRAETVGSCPALTGLWDICLMGRQTGCMQTEGQTKPKVHNTM